MIKEAFKYGQGDVLAGMYPWHPPRIVREVELLGDNRVKIETSDGVTYDVSAFHVMNMPMRPDGSTRVWDTETPKTDEVCIGDALDCNHKRWVVRDVFHIPNAPLTTVGIELYHHSLDETMNCVAQAGRPFIPSALIIRGSRRGESRELREGRPLRGPYRDKLFPETTYQFYVHPSGRGRWPADIPTFQFHDRPGEYLSRPPVAYGKGSFKVWSRLEFLGEFEAGRHPNDPCY